MFSFIGKLFNGNPWGSVTLGGVVSMVVGYTLSHFDPSTLTPAGQTAWTIGTTVVGAIIGVLTHHGNVTGSSAP